MNCYCVFAAYKDGDKGLDDFKDKIGELALNKDAYFSIVGVENEEGIDVGEMMNFLNKQVIEDLE